LDGYNEQQQIAFEYQGPHHTSVDHVMEHDAMKREACTARCIRLIEVEATKRPFPPENVLKKVAEAFQKYGVEKPPLLPNIEIFGAELQRLKNLASNMGGRLISDRYLGGEKHEWKCVVPEHPTWLAEPVRIQKEHGVRPAQEIENLVLMAFGIGAEA